MLEEKKNRWSSRNEKKLRYEKGNQKKEYYDLKKKDKGTTTDLQNTAKN